MIFSASEHRLISSILLREAKAEPDPIRAELKWLARAHTGLARYLDKHPDRYCPVVTVASPSIAPGPMTTPRSSTRGTPCDRRRQR
jgi:hypothetical protein